MPIDDHPFDALEKQFKIEDASVSPVVTVLLSLFGFFPWIWPFDKAFEFLKGRAGLDSAQRAKAMMDACMNEVRRHDAELDQLKVSLSADAVSEREAVVASLIVDAAQKANATRSLNRVRRIGIILANGVAQKALHAEHIEEMMRVAMDLSSSDIDYLGELVRIEGSMVAAHGRIARYDAYQSWEHGRWGTGVNPELDSAFSKLASYGLVSLIPPPNNLNIMADFQNRYALLPKGLFFYTLVSAA